MDRKSTQNNQKNRSQSKGFLEIYIRKDGKLALTALNNDAAGVLKAIREDAGGNEPDGYCG
ncbi:MAG: hypothetical protein PHN57_05405 [Candidatus Omnitrophica bacterium]|nr:hypothetical protein [Candidatus Omnitrophota bacterium]